VRADFRLKPTPIERGLNDFGGAYVSLGVRAERVTVVNGEDTMRNRWLAASVLAAAAVVGLAACGSSSTPTSTTTKPPAASSTTGTSSSTSSSASAAGLKTMTISGHKVLTTADGFVIYWFANDTATTSNCNGSCATYWPPVIGTPSLASGVTLSGKLGTIKRADGLIQATYDGHPLYVFKSDTSAGMASGNDLNASGGLWWAMTASGARIKHSLSSSSSSSGSSSSGSSGSGGYGY
jgi:predicted lipoprotein with Yx(FWY)xxD motif